MNLFKKFLNIVQSVFKLNNSFKIDMEKISEFVQSSQIAMLQTCLAEFVLIEHSQGKSTKNDESNYDIINLIKISVSILD